MQAHALRNLLWLILLLIFFWVADKRIGGVVVFSLLVFVLWRRCVGIRFVVALVILIRWRRIHILWLVKLLGLRGRHGGWVATAQLLLALQRVEWWLAGELVGRGSAVGIVQAPY